MRSLWGSNLTVIQAAVAVLLSATANFSLAQQVGPPPSFTSASIVNSASFAPGISPGSFMTIFGENLAPLTRSWDDAIQGTALPSQLEGVSVTVGGKPAYLAYISPAQLNVLLPTDDIAGSVEVRVTTAQGSSSAPSVMQKYAPGLFLSSLNRRYIAALHADGVPVASANQLPGVVSRPAQPGEEIVLWGTGFGPTAEPVPSGEVLTRAYPLASLGDLRVTISSREAQVTFAGVTIAGVYQINVVVPMDLADGEHAVLAEIGGMRTQENAFLAVQRPSQSTLTDIRVYYRLDPWLIGGTYTGGLWVSPPILGPVTQGGGTFTLETRAVGLNIQGQLMAINPTWIPSDLGMVAVSPSQGNEVTITVLRAGQASLRVTAEGVSKVLVIKAAYQGDALFVEIAQ